MQETLFDKSSYEIRTELNYFEIVAFAEFLKSKGHFKLMKSMLINSSVLLTKIMANEELKSIESIVQVFVFNDELQYLYTQFKEEE